MADFQGFFWSQEDPFIDMEAYIQQEASKAEAAETSAPSRRCQGREFFNEFLVKTAVVVCFFFFFKIGYSTQLYRNYKEP